jgi:hypothetical protein
MKAEFVVRIMALQRSAPLDNQGLQPPRLGYSAAEAGR